MSTIECIWRSHAISSWLIPHRVLRCDLGHHGVPRLDLSVYPRVTDDPGNATGSISHSLTPSSGMASICTDVSWANALCNGCFSTYVASPRDTSTITLNIPLPFTTFMDDPSANFVIPTDTSCSTSWTSKLQHFHTSEMRNHYTEITTVHYLTTWLFPRPSGIHLPPDRHPTDRWMETRR